MAYPIIILQQRLTPDDLNQFRNQPYENLIKFVVDLEQEIIALGGEMHADAEQLLLNRGCHQVSLWGGNLWPWQMPVLLEYVSLINIRPSQQNFGMEVNSDIIKKQIYEVVYKWIRLS